MWRGGCGFRHILEWSTHATGSQTGELSCFADVLNHTEFSQRERVWERIPISNLLKSSNDDIEVDIRISRWDTRMWKMVWEKISSWEEEYVVFLFISEFLGEKGLVAKKWRLKTYLYIEVCNSFVSDYRLQEVLQNWHYELVQESWRMVSLWFDPRGITQSLSKPCEYLIHFSVWDNSFLR